MLKEIGIKKIITVIFIIGGIFAFLIFSNVIKTGSDKGAVSGNIVVWGTIPFDIMQPYIDQSNTKTINVTYKVQNKATYESDILNAFAAGRGPDLFIMPHENILRNADKIFEIPYTSFSKNDYQSKYINEANIFLTNTGVLSIPMSVDPMVMYYNKQLISSAFLIEPPKYWDELSAFSSKISFVDAGGAISQSGVAMGTYDNIRNAKGILTTLLLQNGNRIVGTDLLTGKKRAELAFSDDSFEQAKQALEFYTSFSNFGNSNYSWNESLDSSLEKFITGELALYFGKASEMENIRKKNPNLDFDVTLMPQINETSIKTTYGAMTGVAISKQTSSKAAAISVASSLSGKNISEKLTRDLSIAPVRRDLLKNKPDDARLTLFYNSAIISNAWFDPEPQSTSILFKNLIRSINTDSKNPDAALKRINSELNNVLNRTINLVIENKQEKK